MLRYLPVQLSGDRTAGSTKCPVYRHVEIGLSIFDYDILPVAEDNLYLTTHILATPGTVDIGKANCHSLDMFTPGAQRKVHAAFKPFPKRFCQRKAKGLHINLHRNQFLHSMTGGQVTLGPRATNIRETLRINSYISR